MRQARLAWVLTLPVVLWFAPPVPAQTCGPVQYSIAVDGDMSDWTIVLADPDNFATDPVGASLPSADRDAPIQSRGRDLVGFAYTWDTASIYLYVRRSGSSTNVNNFIFYADRDDNGRMETTDRVVATTWQGSNRSYSMTVHEYSPGIAGGDPLIDAQGYADGYTLPGRLGAVLYAASGTGGAADGEQIEIAVPWNWLGMAAGAPLQFHLSSSNSLNLPNAIDDNMAGPNGAGNSTRWVILSLTPDHSMVAAPGDTIVFAHTVANGGNTAARAELTTTWDCLEPLAATLCRDFDADGRYSPGLDPPLTDSNGDGRVDCDVSPNAPLAILVVVALAPGLTGPRTCTMTVGAVPRTAPDCGGSAVDAIALGAAALELLRSADRTDCAPGSTVTLSTTYTNRSSQPLRAVVLESAIPARTTYVLGSAGGEGMTLLYSHDGGTTWDGMETPPVTHVRWTRAADLSGGSTGMVTCVVRID